MCDGLATLRTAEADITLPYFLVLLAEEYGREGRPEEGLTVLDEVRRLVSTMEERWCEAESSRLWGELVLTLSGKRQTAAETCFQQALTIARRQQAKSWELRAAMSLARLWQQQGKRAEARALLAPIYGWFTEGWGTADLQEAKALLETLA